MIQDFIRAGVYKNSRFPRIRVDEILVDFWNTAGKKLFKADYFDAVQRISKALDDIPMTSGHVNIHLGRLQSTAKDVFNTWRREKYQGTWFHGMEEMGLDIQICMLTYTYDIVPNPTLRRLLDFGYPSSLMMGCSHKDRINEMFTNYMLENHS